MGLRSTSACTPAVSPLRGSPQVKRESLGAKIRHRENLELYPMIIWCITVAILGFTTSTVVYRPPIGVGVRVGESGGIGVMVEG